MPPPFDSGSASTSEPMPVHKYRSIEEMDAHTWRTPGDPTLYRAIAFTWELARRTNPRRFPPGVHKYRNIDEMNRADEQRLDDHLEARRNARRDHPGAGKPIR
jgi:hypothetical protein